MSACVVAALYKFVALPDHADLRAQLHQLCESHGIYGTLLLAEEGINGTVAGSREAIDALRAFLDADGRFEGMEYKESHAEEPPFHRLKVRLKREIVTMGVPDTDPNASVGAYVDAQRWNELLDDPDVLVIDTRNQYEYEVGTFPGAVSPHTDSFREFPDYVSRELDPTKHRKVAMFCTGGIRCEKATNYMLRQGFEEVYHLHGGILRYLEETPAEDNRWQGECFVFDERVSVDRDLQPGSYALCYGCRMPLSPDDLDSPHYEPGICCPHCHDALTEERRARLAERQRQVELARERHQTHIGSRPPADA